MLFVLEKGLFYVIIACCLDRPANVAVKDIAIDVVGLGFDSQAGLTGHSVDLAAMFVRSCIAPALSRGDRPRLSLDDKYGVAADSKSSNRESNPPPRVCNLRMV